MVLLGLSRRCKAQLFRVSRCNQSRAHGHGFNCRSWLGQLVLDFRQTIARTVYDKTICTMFVVGQEYVGESDKIRRKKDIWLTRLDP